MNTRSFKISVLIKNVNVYSIVPIWETGQQANAAGNSVLQNVELNTLTLTIFLNLKLICDSFPHYLQFESKSYAYININNILSNAVS